MKFFLFILSIIFITFVFAGGLEYPKIKKVEHKIVNIEKTTEFVKLLYDVEIEGAYKDYEMIIEIILYNKEEKEIKMFTELIKIKEFEIQIFMGEKMIPMELSYDVDKVGANLKLLRKKY